MASPPFSLLQPVISTSSSTSSIVFRLTFFILYLLGKILLCKYPCGFRFFHKLHSSYSNASQRTLSQPVVSKQRRTAADIHCSFWRMQGDWLNSRASSSWVMKYSMMRARSSFALDWAYPSTKYVSSGLPEYSVHCRRSFSFHKNVS